MKYRSHTFTFLKEDYSDYQNFVSAIIKASTKEINKKHKDVQSSTHNSTTVYWSIRKLFASHLKDHVIQIFFWQKSNWKRYCLMPWTSCFLGLTKRLISRWSYDIIRLLEQLASRLLPYNALGWLYAPTNHSGTSKHRTQEVWSVARTGTSWKGSSENGRAELWKSCQSSYGRHLQTLE